MESLIWSVLLVLAFALLAIGALMVYLFRQTQRNTEQVLTFMAGQVELADARAAESLEKVVESLHSSSTTASTSMAAALSSVQAMQTESLRAVDLMQTRTLSSSADSQMAVTRLLTTSLAMLGTKDPIAAQQMMGAADPEPRRGATVTWSPDGGDVAPYTAADEFVDREVEAQRAKQAQSAEDALSNIEGVLADHGITGLNLGGFGFAPGSGTGGAPIPIS